MSELLDPAGAKAAAAPVLKIALPLLRELVNRGLHVYVLTASQPVGRDEGIARARLYFHVLEMLDAIEVQLREACTSPAEIHLRSQWEASLQLVFMLKQASLADASLAWLVCAVRRKMTELRGITTIEKRLKSRKRKGLSPGPGRTEVAAASMARTRLKRLESALAVPHLARFATVAEPWYRSFDGGSDIEQLAAALHKLQGAKGRELEYSSFYRIPSGLVHAGEYDRIISRTPEGPRPSPLRGTPADVRRVAGLAAGVALEATRAMIVRLCPDYLPELQRWYLEEVRDVYLPLVSAGGSV